MRTLGLRLSPKRSSLTAPRAALGAAAAIILLLVNASATGAQVVRTGDPAKRGLTEADFPRVKRLAEGVYSYEQLRSAGPERFTTVSMFVVTSQGVLVADGQGSVAETRRMLDEIAKVTPQAVTHVVVCSDHGDHTAGNSAFPATARVYAHPTSKAILEASASRGRGAGAGGAAGAGRGTNEAASMPIVAVPDSLVLTVGGREIRLLFLGRAHTGGDLSVFLPRERILFMSEAYLNRIFPAMRSAYPSEWVAAIEKAQAMPVDIFVPGHGFVESPEILREELETFRRAMVQVIAEAKRLRALGLSADAAVERASFGDLESWTLRPSQGAIAIRRVYLELEGQLPR